MASAPLSTGNRPRDGRRLEIRAVSKRYGDIVAVDDLSFTVEPGQLTGFVGPNGSGKTTTMRIIIGMLDSDDGEVLWDGEKIDSGHRRRIGYMPEERGLYPKMRVADQLNYFGELHGLSAAVARERSAEWLDRLGLTDRAEDDVESLSLGNQQRIQLAASLVFEPDILVLDEPFAGLDPIGVDLLSEVLTDISRERGVPVVFSSHQLELVEQLCDTVVIIRDGRRVAFGSVDELKRSRAGALWISRVAGLDTAWDPGLTGIDGRGEFLFELAPDADPQDLLEAALKAGPVTEFREHQPGLVELFRAVVTDHPDREEPPTREVIKTEPGGGSE